MHLCESKNSFLLLQPQTTTSSSVTTPSLPGQPDGGDSKKENLPGQPDGGNDNEEKASDEGHLSHGIGEADEGDHEHGAEQGNEDDMDVGADNEREIGGKAKAIDGL